MLEQQLDVAGDDLTKALPAYEQQRLPDAEALVRLVQVSAADAEEGCGAAMPRCP